MKKITYTLFLSSLIKEHLFFYIKKEISNKDLRKILLAEINKSTNILQGMGIETCLVNECDFTLVLEQNLSYRSRNQLISLIEKNISHKDLIKFLSKILSAREAIKSYSINN